MTGGTTINIVIYIIIGNLLELLLEKECISK